MCGLIKHCSQRNTISEKRRIWLIFLCLKTAFFFSALKTAPLIRERGSLLLGTREHQIVPVKCFGRLSGGPSSPLADSKASSHFFPYQGYTPKHFLTVKCSSGTFVLRRLWHSLQIQFVSSLIIHQNLNELRSVDSPAVAADGEKPSRKPGSQV